MNKFRQLIENARIEMGPEVFGGFRDALWGDHKAPPRQWALECAICNGSGVSSMSTRPDGECAGCDGHGKF
jgi:hypothetical protein